MSCWREMSYIFRRPNWRFQGFLDRPFASIETHTNRRRFNIADFRPFRKCFRFTFVSQKSIASSISRVFLGRYPTAILRRVWSLIVNSINLMRIGGTSTHVSKEGFKTILPAIANGNTSTSIARIVKSIRIMATPFNSRPNSIFGDFVGQSVFCVPMHRSRSIS